MTEELQDTERARILKIIREEFKLPRIGEVEQVYVHDSASDHSNHEADVSIPPGPNETRSHDRVPVAVPASGMVTTPKSGDLVLVNYLAGEGDEPVITQVVYGDADDDRAPLGQEGDISIRRGDKEIEAAGDGSFARIAQVPTDGDQASLVVEIDDTGRVKVGDPAGTLKPVAREGDPVTDSSGNQVGTVDATSTDVESS